MDKRVLYFDIDGTLLLSTNGEPKHVLRDGAFEAAVREAGFQELVCVGNIVNIIYSLRQLHKNVDAVDIIFDLCRGVFQDKEWLRNRISLIADPEHRAKYIDVRADWYYIDDLADYYLRLEKLDTILQENTGGRILIPGPDDDGQAVLDWAQAHYFTHS